MPGGGDPVGGGVQATDEGIGTFLPGATEGTGPVQGVQGGDGGGIFNGAQDDTVWASGGGQTELGNLDRGRRTADISRGLPGQGRPAELPGGWIPRTSDGEDGNVDPFSAPACPGHRGNFGGGKPLPPTVPPMRCAGPLAYTEQKATCHCTVRQGGGAK